MEDKLNVRRHQCEITSMEDDLQGGLPQWKITSDQAGTELDPACFTQLPQVQVRGYISKQILKLCLFSWAVLCLQK